MAQTVIIVRPPLVVFAFRCAMANSPDWQRGVLSARLEAPGPVCLGSRCTEVRKGPQDSVEEWALEVTEYEPTRVLGISSCWEQIRCVERHLFAGEGGSTRYTYAVEVTGSPLPAATIQRQMVETALQLKWALETSYRHA